MNSTKLISKGTYKSLTVFINPNAISATISVTTQKTFRVKISNVIAAREEDMPMQIVILPIEPNMLSTSWTTTLI
jgi:hypothetical protein